MSGWRNANDRCAWALLSLHLLVVFRSPCEHAEALEFRVPKPGRSYDTSEMVFAFERDAHEDGYPVLEVDGVVMRSFDFKAMEYEISMMGQQVGQHYAVVRLMEVTHDAFHEPSRARLQGYYILAERHACMPMPMRRMHLCTCILTCGYVIRRFSCQRGMRKQQRATARLPTRPLYIR